MVGKRVGGVGKGVNHDFDVAFPPTNNLEPYLLINQGSAGSQSGCTCSAAVLSPSTLHLPNVYVE